MAPSEAIASIDDDPWTEHGFTPQCREALCRFLVERREDIVEGGTSWVVGTAVDLQGRRPRAETRKLVARVVDLHLAWLLHGQLEPRERFIEFVTTYRASDRFHISTLLRGFSSFKKGAERLLPQSPLPAQDQLRALILLDTCSAEALYEMSDLYVGRLNDQILAAREREVRAEEREAQLVLERERNQALEQAKLAAEAANEAKSRFLAHISHELRTPLNSVIGFSQYLLGDLGLQDEHRRTVDDIHQSGRALLEMINEVLEMSRIEAGAVDVKLDVVELSSFLRQLQTILEPHAASGVQLEVGCEGELPPCVRTDRSKLRQILLNLLGNALKLTRRGHVRCIASQPASTQDGVATLRFSVEDTGPGIPANDLGAVFEPFVQSETGRASGKGVGLGLSIVRSYVGRLGGRLGVESEVGKGTRFCVELPVAVAKAEATGSDPTTFAAEQAAAFKVLIVDDHPTNRQLLLLTLRRWGFQVEQAAGGFEAITKAKEWRPSLVFMDVRMPDLDGLEATRRIHAELGVDAPVVVALTANVFGTAREDAIRAGCSDFLLKPVDFDAITRVLKIRLLDSEELAASSEPRLRLASEVLSARERTSVRLAAVALDLDRLEQWLSTCAALDESTRASLQEWVEDFQFGKVLQWLER